MKIFLIISLLYSPFFYLSAQERIIISDKFNAVENYYTTKGNEFLVTRNSAEVKLKEVMDESGNSFYILTDEFIVALNDNYSENDLILLLSHKNCAVLKKYKYLNHYKIKSSSNNFSEIYNYLNSSSIIKYVDPIFALADISVLGGSNSDPYLDYQYYLNNMKILDVWNENVLGENVIIAVMDEGIQPEHEDLHANIFINYSELNGTPGIDDDDNGYIDDINGWNSISNNGDVYPSTDPEHPTLYQNHGMNVAGIIAAGINNLGIIGVAPLSKILPIKFYDRYIPNNSSQGINLFYTDVFIDAMEYILTIREQFNKRIVISFSLGWYPSVQPASIINILELSVSEPFYIPFFAAPGNNGNHPILFPASLPTTFSVARTGSSDNWINNSNPAGFENDFAAPGYNITTTDDIHRSGYTFNWSGTSASTPMAAGIAALLLSVKNDLSVEQLSTILKNSADKVGGVNYYWNPQMPGHSIELGYGRLNAFRAYRSIVNMEFINDVEGISMGQLKVNGQTINSGYNEVFISGSNVQAEIVSNIYSNGIHNTKFYRWNFNDINGQRRNHLHNFIVNPEENQLISSYKRTKQITVRNYFEGGNGHTILFGEKNFDVTSRTSPHLENAFIYQPQVVEATYHATAEPTHTNHLGTNWYFQNWENGSTSLAREEQITQSSSSEWRANYKGIQRSDQWSTYTNNNQRKLIRGDNGVLYNVYESINKVWLEKSTNNGVSWQIANKGKPLSNIVSKNPSMCNYGGIPIIVLEEEGYINIYKYEPTIDSAISKLRFDSGNTNFSATPVIGYSFSQFSLSKIMVIWKINDIYWYEPGLYFILIDTDPFNWTKPNEVMISNTNLYSLNPSIDTYISTSGYPRYYHLAWEQEGTIRYCKLVEDASGNIAQTNHSVISNGSSYIFHSSPSIIAIGTGARVCWLGWNDTDPIVSAVIFRDPANSRFWSFGSNVSKPNINKSNDNTYYAFGWSQNNSTVKFADNSLRSVYEIIGITGKDVQISNGNGKTNMFANIFKAASQPYFFTMSNNLNHYYSIQKSNGMLVSSGRTGVIRKNGGEVYFALGDIAVNNQKVEFVECSPETDISNTSQLNQYLETEPFEVTDNSGFEYTVQYGTVDTSLASGMFSQGEQVRFKVELIDNNSGELLGVFDDVVYDQNNLADFENILYQVNTQGIGQRTVKLRLRIEENINPVVSMVDRIDNEGALTKGKRKELKYEGETIPKEFALEQNYPNPFNPSTKISWQSPVGSHTTLKVYDILGNEIATLVDEYRAAGKHKVEFDASALASGVYIYKLTAGSFISSKKMMVIK